MKSTSGKYILVVTLMLACINLSAQITSTFSANAEGWTTPNDADGTIAHSTTGGNPGGFVFGTPFAFITGAGTIYIPFYFVAPAAYLGNRSTYYNGTLQYDIQTTSATAGTTYQNAEVVIANSGGVTLYYYPAAPNQPVAAPGWSTFSVTLNNTLGFWKTTDSPTGSAATEAQLLNILTDLSNLQLRGLYRNANTTNRLDNVSFRPPITITTQPSSSATCTGPTLTLTTAATNNPVISYQWQRETSPTVWTNVTNTGGYGGATTASLSINTTGNFGAGNYRCRISGTAVDDALTNTAVVTVNPLPSAPTTTGNAACGSSAITLNAAGGSAGQYRWYTVPTAGTAIAGQTNNSYTTPVITITTTYYVAINNGTCQSTRTTVVATINTPPVAPTVTGNSYCGSSAITLNAAGGAAGQYRWYTVPTGGTAIAGQTNNTYTTPVIAITTNYYVAINNGTCQSTRTLVVATVNTPPAAPTVTGNSSCGTSAITLNAAGGVAGQYRWYTVPTGGTAIAGQTNNSYTTPIISITTTYYVGINTGTCESTRTPVVATINIVQATITQVDNTLIASAGTSFQWFLFGQPIANATNQILEINLYETAIYTVEITQGICTSLSGEFVYLITETEKDMGKIKLYPNPTIEELTIEMPPNISYTVSIVDMLGKECISLSHTESSKKTISLKDLQSGSYVVILRSAQSKSYIKIIKQ